MQKSSYDGTGKTSLWRLKTFYYILNENIYIYIDKIAEIVNPFLCYQVICLFVYTYYICFLHYII